jgi:hypothetical protein
MLSHEKLWQVARSLTLRNPCAPFIHSFIVDEWETTNLHPPSLFLRFPTPFNAHINTQLAAQSIANRRVFTRAMISGIGDGASHRVIYDTPSLEGSCKEPWGHPESE